MSSLCKYNYNQLKFVIKNYIKNFQLLKCICADLQLHNKVLFTYITVKSNRGQDMSHTDLEYYR
jgi:hypothetical protein